MGVPRLRVATRQPQSHASMDSGKNEQQIKDEVRLMDSVPQTPSFPAGFSWRTTTDAVGSYPW
jgi:hypothetical protein